jgi:hypothetical protein
MLFITGCQLYIMVSYFPSSIRSLFSAAVFHLVTLSVSVGCQAAVDAAFLLVPREVLLGDYDRATGIVNRVSIKLAKLSHHCEQATLRGLMWSTSVCSDEVVNVLRRPLS